MLVTQLYSTLCNSMDYSPPCSSVRGILQARILEWVAIPFSNGSSQPRDWTWNLALQADSLLLSPPNHQETIKKISLANGQGGGEGMDWEFGVSRCRLLHIEWINNKSYCMVQGIIFMYSEINRRQKSVFFLKPIYILIKFKCINSWSKKCETLHTDIETFCPIVVPS